MIPRDTIAECLENFDQVNISLPRRKTQCYSVNTRNSVVHGDDIKWKERVEIGQVNSLTLSIVTPAV